MATLYDTTELDAASNPIEYLIALNNLSAGVLSWAILLIINIALLIVLYKGDFKSTLLATSAINIIFILTGFAIGLFNEVQLGISIAFLVISVIMSVWRRN